MSGGPLLGQADTTLASLNEAHDPFRKVFYSFERVGDRNLNDQEHRKDEARRSAAARE